MRNFILTSFIFILSLIGYSQQQITAKYRLSNNFAPHVIEANMVTYTDETSRIFNEADQLFAKETYSFFDTDGNNFWGLTEDKWCFGTCDSAKVKLEFDKEKFDKIINLGLGYYFVMKGDEKLFLNINLFNNAHKFVKCETFESIQCVEFEQTVIVSKKANNNHYIYGCMSIESGRYISDYFVDSIITCPRTFDEIALVKKDGKYQFYNFLLDKKASREYMSYKRIPIYRTVMGIFENGVEIMDNEQIHSFELGLVQSVRFDNMGDYVYAYIKTDKGEYKIDVWEKVIMTE